MKCMVFVDSSARGTNFFRFLSFFSKTTAEETRSLANKTQRPV
jgi:hypothetical protein